MLQFFAFTGKKVKGDNNSTIKNHLFWNHSSAFDESPYYPAKTMTLKLP